MLDTSCFERRDKRFERWMYPPNVSFDDPKAEELYRTKVSRLIKAIRKEKPDRVPVVLPLGLSFPAYYCGYNLRDIMYDYRLLEQCWIKVAQDFEMDVFGPPALVHPARFWEILGNKQWTWPGRGLPEDAETYQFVEGEYMYDNEYAELLRDPSDFLLRKLLPRTCEKLVAFSSLSPLRWYLFNPALLVSNFSQDEVQKTLELFLEAAREWQTWASAVSRIASRLLEMGIPRLWEVIAMAPFDFLGDTLRGTKGIMLDMYRRPKQLLETLEWLLELISNMVIEQAKNSISPVVFIPLHKGAHPFMSSSQFETFYWPTLKRLILNLINEGLVPWVFAEGDYNPRLQIISDLPYGSVVWHFETVDMKLAKQTVGKNCCIAGNLSPLLFMTGSPDTVKESAVRLLKLFADEGGFILAAAASVNKAKPENIRALFQVVSEL